MASIREAINQLFKQGDWQTALDVQTTSDDYNTVLWIRPTLADLHFIYAAMKSRGLNLLISIGCGSGFLEWVLASATGLQVVGVEQDPNWWTSPYIQTYIPHIYTGDPHCSSVLRRPQSAVMFCYFNNGKAFHDYLTTFAGKCVIIIGPKSHRHTNPHPFQPLFENDQWILKEYKQIGDSFDYIVVYDKVDN
ncbi:uncharacterized protein LOC129005466 [Macrosteles quadrilineatus]|uniref:uncharacterized protein LOC129005466 n=1 Tax=Macrosteles quadrilineatus TaxID=74068 RepID=UPI0023E1817A|nr:uncharacterized protein LOC129005466 [Macrosteles quadrilineatus]